MDSKVLDFTSDQIKKELPELAPGQIVRVSQKIKEGDKERIQVFEGLVIAIKGDSPSNRMLHVRKVSEGVGVERIFPVNSPLITDIEVVKSGKVRRAKLYYIREKERKVKEDEKKQARIEKAKQEIEEKRVKEAELKAQREEAQKKAEEEAKKEAEKPKEESKTENKEDKKDEEPAKPERQEVKPEEKKSEAPKEKENK